MPPLSQDDQTDNAIAALKARLMAGKPGVLARTLVADLDTPVSAYLKLAADQPYSCLLESVADGEHRGRYSIIGVDPDLAFQIQDGQPYLDDGMSGTWTKLDEKPFDAIRRLLAENAIDLPRDLPPMAAGLVGYFGYDFVREVEHLPDGKQAAYDTPAVFLIRPTVMAVFDSVTNLITLVTPVRPYAHAAPAPEKQVSGSHQPMAEPEVSPLIDALIEAASARLDAKLAKLIGPVPSYETAVQASQLAGQVPPDGSTSFTSNTPAEDYMDMVKKAQDYILAGDIFQVVLSQRFSMPFSLPPFALYRALRRTNPSPYMYHLDFDGLSVVGSSPEILVALEDRRVTIRPIAGTRPRGKDHESDQALERDLLADPKELSEHLMLLDLGRNDVGRVAREGSVSVTDRNFIERYSHVMHIVSNVEGELRDGFDAVDALAAGFPAGTVSGAPKVRAMEIIDELERDGRGLYAGAVGYFSASGSMDTAIVLRTAVIKDGVMHVQAGAGVVADSDPLSEQRECEAKAGALVGAAREAVRFAKANGPIL